MLVKKLKTSLLCCPTQKLLRAKKNRKQEKRHRTDHRVITAEVHDAKDSQPNACAIRLNQLNCQRGSEFTCQRLYRCLKGDARRLWQSVTWHDGHPHPLPTSAVMRRDGRFFWCADCCDLVRRWRRHRVTFSYTVPQRKTFYCLNNSFTGKQISIISGTQNSMYICGKGR